ncbi:type IV secretion system protein VirB9 [Paraburkholderia sp. BL8N3]|nr:P-type conjugative transfer protein TrbG [Paraburkholderia sp. BL8N3]TCK31787.1 type IV secretion system protein VirB9 [Paraburkholderia sp. BL8N3]
MKKWVALLAFVALSANAMAGQRFLTLEDAAVAQAKKWQQTGQAKPIISDDGRIMYPFGQYLPKLTCTVMRVCDIQLQPGELVTGKPVAGDTARWMMSKQVSGTGDTAITHIIVKPTDTNIQTNLIITTDRRTYQIELTSSANEKDYLNMIGFYYPEEMTSEWDESARLKAKEQKAHDSLVAAELPVGAADRLDFDYSIDGGSDVAFKPTRVYNDGLKTYIQLPDGVPMAEAPVLLLIDKDNKPAIVNYRPKTPTLYEVDKLFDKAMLVLGTDGNEQKITITWNKHKRSFWARVGGN